MTRAQERTIEEIKRLIPKFDFYNSDNYEIKEFTVREDESIDFVSIYFVTGRKNDDGTMASVIARKYRHAIIGKNGGIMVFRRKGRTTFRATVFDFMNKHYYC